MAADDVGRLVEVIRRDHREVQPSRDLVWTAAPPVRVIDCVLSLNRHYDRFVVPRVKRFVARFPEIQTCSDLRAAIARFDSPNAFVADALDYKHAARAEALSGVVDFLIGVQPRYPGSNETARLSAWAIASKPLDYRQVGVKGFKIAGFQYLRMLFGAETTKPDIRIRAFVAEAIGRRVSEVEAVTLIEEAGARAGLSIRWLDFAIWEDASRPTHCGAPPSCPRKIPSAARSHRSTPRRSP